MVEAQSQNEPVPIKKGTTVVVPIAAGSPSASEMRRRRRRRSRLMSTSSSVMSAAAAGIPSAEKNKISNNEALMHIVKATIGGGFLGMPEAFHNAGIITGIVGTSILGLAVLNLMACIVRCSQSLRSDDGDKRREIQLAKTQYDSKELVLPPMDYPDTVAAVFQYGARGRFSWWAPIFRKITTISLVTTYYGVNIIYVCIVASTCKQLVDQYTANSDVDSWWSSMHGISIRWYPAITALIIVPVGMVRLIKLLVPFSITANVCMLIGTIAIFYFIFFGDDGREPLHPEEQAKMVVWPPNRWTLFMGSALCSLEGVGMLLHVENAMSRPRELVGPPAYTLHRSMFVIVTLNALLGTCGYLRYGDRCTGSVSLNLPLNNKLSDAIKIIIAFAILLTYGLQLTVTADLAWQGLRKLGGISEEVSGDGEEETVEEEEWTPKLTLYYYSMRLILILGSIMVAIAVPDIGPLISLVGSVGFSMLGLIIPVIMETVWHWYPQEDDDDDGEPEHDIHLSANGHGAAMTDGGLTTTTTTTTNNNNTADAERKVKDNTSGGSRRFFRRAVRHVKNIALIILAMFALIGGAYYNILDIINIAEGGTVPAL